MDIFRRKKKNPTTHVVWDKKLLRYNFGPSHPMNPIRLDLTSKLMQNFGLFDLKDVKLIKPRKASDTELAETHNPTYIASVHRAEHGVKDKTKGLGSEDVPLFDEIHDTSALIYGASTQAAESIISGKAIRAFNFSGGMHHASSDKAGGFCVYNDIAGAIKKFLNAGYHKILYIDLDAHHGDGTQNIFWKDPRVVTISIHESGKTLYPGTGTINEIGHKKAKGTSINVPLPAGTSNADWLRTFHAIVPQIVEAWHPEIIVSQHGCDGHRSDYLTHLNLTIDAFAVAATKIRDLSEKYCNGKWLATGGGGYNILDVVPRAWTQLLAVLANKDLPLESLVPQTWIDYVKETQERDVCETLGDKTEIWWRSWEIGHDTTQPIDKIITEVRTKIFPYYDLDPWFS
ncbi:MAG: acetoin utilization protein AcuC [Micrococcaceae bacterium]